jgi:hypothetical protein
LDKFDVRSSSEAGRLSWERDPPAFFPLLDFREFFGDAEDAQLHIVRDWDLVPPTSLDSRSEQLAELHNRGAFGCIIMSGIISFLSIGKKEDGLGFRFLDWIVVSFLSNSLDFYRFLDVDDEGVFFLFFTVHSRTHGRRLRFGDFRACPLAVSWETPVFCFIAFFLLDCGFFASHRSIGVEEYSIA